MRAKWIPVNNQALIAACKSDDREAQRYLYEKFSPILYAICRRYIKDPIDAEDALVESFYKIFTKLHQLEDPNVFEGWAKRIAVNESLMWLRKRKKMKITEIDGVNEPRMEPKSIEKLKEQDILELLDLLPSGYRTVFNLYVVEGYKHREIAEKLGISINTSKSQLIMAKKKLKVLIEDQSKTRLEDGKANG